LRLGAFGIILMMGRRFGLFVGFERARTMLNRTYGLSGGPRNTVLVEIERQG